MSRNEDFIAHDLETAPEAARPLLEQTQQEYGMVPNLMKQMALAPALLRGYRGLGESFAQSSLTAEEQQVVLLAVSVADKCDYCVGAHSVVADMAEVPAQAIDALRDGEPIDDHRLQALRVFTEAVVRERGWVTDVDVERFRGHGFDAQQVLEVVLGVGMKTISNYTNHIVGTELDEAFASRRWHPSH